MASIQYFPNKRPNEIVTLTFDFRNRLASGETFLDSGIWTEDVEIGTDPDYADMLIGLPSVSGTTISHRVQAGLNNVVYLITCETQTNQSHTYEGAGLLKVSTKLE